MLRVMFNSHVEVNEPDLIPIVNQIPTVNIAMHTRFIQLVHKCWKIVTELCSVDLCLIERFAAHALQDSA